MLPVWDEGSGFDIVAGAVSQVFKSAVLPPWEAYRCSSGSSVIYIVYYVPHNRLCQLQNILGQASDGSAVYHVLGTLSGTRHGCSFAHGHDRGVL